jgi:hypothetical protein
MLVTLDDVALDARGWKPHESKPFDRSWYDASGDPVRVRLFDQPCPESTVEGWWARARRECATAGGAVLSFDDAVVDGLPAFRGVLKYRAANIVRALPEGSLAVYVVGMITIPLGDHFVQINTEAIEHGATGAREAIYGVLHPPPPPTQPPEVVTGDELFARLRGNVARVLPSDAEEHDALVPAHPLSRVRASQRHVIATTRIGPAARQLARE